MVHGRPAAVLPAPEAGIINPSPHLVHDIQSSVVLLAASKSSGSLVLNNLNLFIAGEVALLGSPNWPRVSLHSAVVGNEGQYLSLVKFNVGGAKVSSRQGQRHKGASWIQF